MEALERYFESLNPNHPGFLLFLLWSLVWKGLATWRAARKDQKYWFIALLVINTAGLLEIFYLLTFGKEETKLAKKRK